jgi:hypothetical protein
VLGVSGVGWDLVDAGAPASFDLRVNVSRHPIRDTNQQLRSPE